MSRSAHGWVTYIRSLLEKYANVDRASYGVSLTAKNSRKEVVAPACEITGRDGLKVCEWLDAVNLCRREDPIQIRAEPAKHLVPLPQQLSD